MNTRKRLLPALMLFCVAGCASTPRIDELEADLRSPHAAVRLRAVKGMSSHRIDAARAVPALTNALTDLDPMVRRFAAAGLGNRGREAASAEPALAAALRDPDPRVRKAASKALRRTKS